jgi:hypothetical protein
MGSQCRTPAVARVRGELLAQPVFAITLNAIDITFNGRLSAGRK